MAAIHIVICGYSAERIRSIIQSREEIDGRFSIARDSYHLPGIDLATPLDVVIADGVFLEDPIFRNWRRRRSADLPIIWIVKKKETRLNGGGFGNQTALPESDLAALPFMLAIIQARKDARRELESSPAGLKPVNAVPPPIIGRSKAIRKVIASAQKVLNVSSSVLVLGESGTGKELVASMVHMESTRLNKPFVKVNCAAIPETLLESELFGIEKRIATDVDRRIGKFEQANGGTVFLDEIGDMSLITQAKILRILQEKEFDRVGGTRAIRVDARIIAATNKDLPTEIAAGRFRSDLYYRLNVINIRIPPLRERREDIPDLVRHFIDLYRRENSLPPKEVPEDIVNILMRYDWPGNVRELENAIERAVVIGDGDEIRRQDLPSTILNALQLVSTTPDNLDSFHVQIAEFERGLLIDALDRCNWVQARAARKLGMSERSMWHLFKKHKLEELKVNGKIGLRGNWGTTRRTRETL